MPGKRANPMIRRLSELFISGSRTGFFDIATAAGTSSPRSPLDHTRTQSPRGLKNYDLGGCGVGLGIVAALDESSTDSKHEILAKRAVCSPCLNRSSCPIPVYSPGKNCQRCVELEEEEEDMDSSENFTYVTCHLPNKSVTKVYYDVSEYNGVGLERRSDKSDSISNPKESPARFREDFAAYPTSDFLSSCHLCKKKLQGKDIYMYRGEKAFCSVECRSSQIMIDERKEQCRSEVPRSADVSSSSYTRSPIFSAGIVAI